MRKIHEHLAALVFANKLQPTFHLGDPRQALSYFCHRHAKRKRNRRRRKQRELAMAQAKIQMRAPADVYEETPVISITNGKIINFNVA